MKTSALSQDISDDIFAAVVRALADVSCESPAVRCAAMRAYLQNYAESGDARDAQTVAAELKDPAKQAALFARARQSVADNPFSAWLNDLGKLEEENRRLRAELEAQKKINAKAAGTAQPHPLDTNKNIWVAAFTAAIVSTLAFQGGKVFYAKNKDSIDQVWDTFRTKIVQPLFHKEQKKEEVQPAHPVPLKPSPYGPRDNQTGESLGEVLRAGRAATLPQDRAMVLRMDPLPAPRVPSGARLAAVRAMPRSTP